jgi:hypothetical protein
MLYRIRFKIENRWYAVGQDQWGYITTALSDGIVFDSASLMQGIAAAYMFADENTRIELIPLQ